MTVPRFDRGSLQSPEMLPSGWLRVGAHITRTGIFHYQNPDGSIRRELRLPDEVFDRRSLDSFAMVPVTNNHPPGLLDAKNTRQYQVGHAGETIYKDGDFVAARLMIVDEPTIADVRAGKVEISNGYECDLEMTPGEINGLKYDAIQRNIRGNHIAIVDKGRAGPDAKIKMDSSDSVMICFDALVTNPGKEKTHMEITINGKTVKVSAELGAEIEAMIAAEAAEMPADGKEKPAADPATPAKADRAGIVTRLTAERDRLLAERDALKAGQVKEAQTKADKAAEERIRGEVKARLGLEAHAARILGSKFDCEGKTDRAIREAVIKHFDTAVKLDGKSDAYIEASFDIALKNEGAEALASVREQAEGRGDSADHSDIESVSIEKIRADRLAHQAKRGTAPLSR